MSETPRVYQTSYWTTRTRKVIAGHRKFFKAPVQGYSERALPSRSSGKAEVLNRVLSPSLANLLANPGRVFVLDMATNKTVGAPISVGFVPAGVSIGPDGRYAYIANNGSGTISVVDTISRAVVGSINVPSGPLGIAVLLRGFPWDFIQMERAG